MATALRRAGLVLALLAVTFLPCCIAFGLGVSEGPPAFAASRGQGTAGTFTPTARECTGTRGGQACHWRGTFTSDDGRVRLSGVTAGTGDPPPQDAVFLLNRGRVHPEGTTEWRQWAFWGVLGAAGLAAHAAAALRWAARRLSGASRCPG
ncbi:hypothetical protein ACFOVU_00025 [Nocardiopsis sediminis]|uniref:DUF3592 domain-containing protein n=1 Tax=Nocardiopsis sediminis TaxID=1778267 RepID=A0ABV8FDT9_9ACTN